MNKEKEMRPDFDQDVETWLNQDAETWLNELFRSYALIASVVISASAHSGSVGLRDLDLAKEIVQTLSEISNLIETERIRRNHEQNQNQKGTCGNRCLKG